MIKIYRIKISDIDNKRLKKEIIKRIVKDILMENIKSLYNIDTNDIELAIAERGKPYLKDFPNLFFNFSDSKDLIFLAVSDKNIGIDVEYMGRRQNLRYLGILERFFNKEEQDFVLNQDKSLHLNYFTLLWTYKESLLKYIGCGIGKDMQVYTVCFDNGVPYSIYEGSKLRFRNFCFGDYFVSVCYS